MLLLYELRFTSVGTSIGLLLGTSYFCRNYVGTYMIDLEKGVILGYGGQGACDWLLELLGG